MEQEAMMFIEVIAAMFIPSIMVNAISWIIINKHMEARDKKLRESVSNLVSSMISEARRNIVDYIDHTNSLKK
jgi:hypothetical protein